MSIKVTLLPIRLYNLFIYQKFLINHNFFEFQNFLRALRATAVGSYERQKPARHVVNKFSKKLFLKLLLHMTCIHAYSEYSVISDSSEIRSTFQVVKYNKALIRISLYSYAPIHQHSLQNYWLSDAIFFKSTDQPTFNIHYYSQSFIVLQKKENE